MIKRGIIILVLVGHYLITFPQIETIRWQECLGTDNGYNYIQAIAKSLTGYMFGITIKENGPGVTNYHDGSDSWIVCTDSIGNIIWERCYGGSLGESPVKLVNIDDSTYYLLSYADSNDGDIQNNRGGDFWIVKINSSGQIIWENSYGGSERGEELRDAILMPDHGLLCMGRIFSTGGDVTTFYGWNDVWVFRIDSTGNLIWQKTFGNQGNDNALKIKLTSRNTVLMIGCHGESGGMIDCPDPQYNFADVWLVEMDLHGNLLNQWCYGGTYWDQGRDIIEMEDGYVIAASTISNDGDVSGFHGVAGENDYDDFWIVKIDFDGNIIWQKCLGGYLYEFPVYLTQIENKGIIIIGNTSSDDGDVTANHSAYGNTDIWIVKLDKDGELEWEHCFGGFDVERFWSIHLVLKKDDYDYVIGANCEEIDGDVECDLFPNDWQKNAWLLEIKDCSYYAPEIPSISSGPDTVCRSINPSSNYNTDPATWAWDYEWTIEPPEAGVISWDSISAMITWNDNFEGLVAIKARSYNDCGFSTWSDPHSTFVYSGLGIGEQGGMEAGKQGGLEIWPNPASGEIHVRWNMDDGRFYKDFSLMIYDMYGREIMNISVPENEREIQFDVGNFPRGLYLVVLQNESKIIGSSKLIISR